MGVYSGAFKALTRFSCFNRRNTSSAEIVAISATVGAVYGVAVSTRDSFAAAVLIGILNGVVIAACIAGAEIFLQLGAHHLSLAGYRADYKGDHGSSLKYDQLEATYQWDLVDLENWIAGTSFGPVLQVK